MSPPRRIHERDAYPTRERRYGSALAYSAEGDIFNGLYPPYDYNGPGILTIEQAEVLIERAYAKYAPRRQRPRLLMPRYKRVKFEGNASYTVCTHTIWAPLGWLDTGILLHEVAHSLTWNQKWAGHGPEFFRMLVELNCWHLKMDVAHRVKLARDHYGLAVPDRLRLGDDPTKVEWIRSKR